MIRRNNNIARSSISLLTRHRWIPLLEARPQRWLCHPQASVMYESVGDPICFGCRSTIVFSDLADYPDAYRPTVDKTTGETVNTAAMLEKLAVRLDILFCELKMKEGAA